MKKDFTRIAVILDRSGSMASAVEGTIEGFNKFINDQKSLSGTATVKLVQFDTKYETVFDKPLTEVPEMTTAMFVPRGGTALLDAQGRTITELGEEISAVSDSDRPDNVIVITITDGHENASTDYNRDQVKKMVEHQQTAYNWKFVYLGANQDAIAVGASMGILAKNSLTYNVSDPKAYASVYTSMSTLTRSVRAHASSGFSEQERSAAVGGKN